MPVRILWGSPLPPVRSGVSDYAVELLRELREVADVRILTPPSWSRPEDWALDGGPPLVPTATEPEADEVQLVHLGNNPYHEWLLPRVESPRTVLVLHDLVLHHLLVEATVAHNRWTEYEERLQRATGDAGGALAAARRCGISGRRDPFLYPARAAYVGGQRGVVVHSEWARRLVSQEFPELPVDQVGLAVADPGPVDRAQVRRRLGVPAEAVLLMHLGFLTPEKGLMEILGGVAAARMAGAPVHLVLVGEGRALTDLGLAVDSLGLAANVSATGWVAVEEMRRLPAAADLGVVLRTPSAGETSAAAVRFLACGTPVAVGGTRQFLEWPEDAAPRLTPGPSAAADLARLLCRAAATRGGEAWASRRAAAREIYRRMHAPERVARRLTTFLESLD